MSGYGLTSRLEQDVKRYEKRLAKAATKRTETKKAQAAWLALSAKVRQRDGNQCRICTCQTTRWGVGDPRFWSECHHIVFRSAGGPDSLENCINTCRRCHAAIHAHEIDLSGTADTLIIKRSHR